MLADPVVLSVAKDLIAACNRHEILRCAGHPVSRLDELLPWNWAKLTALARAA
jgi:hypothetical protein